MILPENLTTETLATILTDMAQRIEDLEKEVVDLKFPNKVGNPERPIGEHE